jgi:type VI protein secretion system component VasK
MNVWRRLASVLAGLLLCAACVVLAVFLHREGIVLAGAWAGVIGLLGIPIGCLGVWLAWPGGKESAELPEQESQVSIQHNEASYQGVNFAVQDGTQTIYYKQPDNISDMAGKQQPDKESEE